MRNRFLYLLIASQVSSFGQSLRVIDSDNKGNDDVIGSIMQLSGSALMAFLNGDTKGFRKYLKIIADTINEFLASPE